MTRTLDLIIITIMAALLAIAFYYAGYDAKRVRMVQATTIEKTAVLLKTCFPEGIYHAEAAPTCPAFKAMLVDEMNQNEAGDGQ